MILIRYILDILAEDKKFKKFGDSIQDSKYELLITI